jgi:S-adenosylmethionine:tRNA ribosyltransferase-isomerase
MKLNDFAYTLPEELIAQYPLEERGDARLLVLERTTGAIVHSVFNDITHFLSERDVLVINNTKVFKARLQGKKKTGGSVEILLIKEQAPGVWEAMLSHAKRIKEKTKVLLTDDAYATVQEKHGSRCLLTFSNDVQNIIDTVGRVPLPHYIKREPARQDEEYYQAVFARKEGSIAAPTASLHFTDALLKKIQAQGVKIVEITLHIGPGTFKPIRSENIEEHAMESEFFEIGDATRVHIQNATRVIAVGTSVCRALETFGQTNQTHGQAALFIYPGYQFKSVNGLVTNFHLPCSTPLLLVSAFAGRETIRNAYATAITEKYRFLSYGDAMLII